MAATRFYFPAYELIAPAPAVDAAWKTLTGATRHRLVTPKSAGPLADSATISFASGAGSPALCYQYISDKMNAGIDFTGATVKMYLRALELVASDDVLCNVGVRIFGSSAASAATDCDTLRQVLITVGEYGTAKELSTIYESRAWLNGDAVAGAYTTNANGWDRLCVEFGFASAAGTTPAASVTVGMDLTLEGPQLVDLLENETSTTIRAGWIEFSNTITFPVVAPTGVYISG